MKSNIVLFISLSISLNCQHHYRLALEKLGSRSIFYPSIFNFKKDQDPYDLYYTGKAKNFKNVLDPKDDYYNSPLILIFDKNFNSSNVKYFSKDTIFLIESNFYNFKNNFTNYTAFTISKNDDLESTLDNGGLYYVQLAKHIDMRIIIILACLGLVSLIMVIFYLCSMNTKLTAITLLNLPLYYVNNLICNLSWMLFGCNVMNISCYPFLGPKIFDSIAEYFLLIFYTIFYKVSFYSMSILFIKGWMTTTFLRTEKDYCYYLKRLLLYEAISIFIINFSMYIVCFTDKLNLYYFRTELEQILSIIFLYYNFKNVLTPLYKQMNYVQSINNNFLYECLKFKFIKMKKMYIFYIIYIILNIISPFIEHPLVFCYYYNIFFHYTFKIFYQVMFYLGLSIIFMPKTLPINFYNEIIYNYKEIICYDADIYENDDKSSLNNKLNISILNKKELKNYKYPILLINPFTSSKDKSLFNKIQIGFVGKA